MKLYTEETIRFIAKAIYEHDFDSEKTSDELVDELTTAIELPSDEEIKYESYNWFSSGVFRIGAKWVIEQIKKHSEKHSLADEVQFMVSKGNIDTKVTETAKLVKDMRDAGLLSTPTYTLPMVDTIGITKQQEK